MTARLVIVWIWSLSGGQREREKTPPQHAKDQWGWGLGSHQNEEFFY